MLVPSLGARLSVSRRALGPVLLARDIWTSAVADAAAVRFNLRLLALLTGVFSLPDIGQGLLTVARATTADARLYGAYVLALGLFELCGALLLARRRPRGRALILVAAVGFYLEAALGLAHYERGLLAGALFALCIPAEAWVIWFLAHPRTRAHIGGWARPDDSRGDPSGLSAAR